MTYNDVATAAAALHLTPLGGFHDDTGTTILLGPREPGFWDYVSAQPEFSGEDPLDRWSQNTITRIAITLDASAVFPFGGPPYHPFISWALNSGEAWLSPVGLLVHKEAGLLASYRGALQFAGHIPLPSPAQKPCDTCNTKPCLDACPVAALSPSGYNVPLCQSHIETDAVCAVGCRVRRVCPVSQSYGRAPAQTAFHMKAFIKE